MLHNTSNLSFLLFHDSPACRKWVWWCLGNIPFWYSSKNIWIYHPHPHVWIFEVSLRKSKNPLMSSISGVDIFRNSYTQETTECSEVMSPDVSISWWRHQMETFSALLAICAGNSPVPVNSPHKGQWRGALMFTLICARIYSWVNNSEAGEMRRYRAHYDVIVMS